MMPRAPAFWSAAGPLPTLLAPAAWLYGAVAARRIARPAAWRAPLPVAVVGNLVTGGAGKTPTVLWLAARLAALDARPTVVMRGYGGRLTGPVEVDPSRHGATDVGDEAVMVARSGQPVVVARDRAAGVRLAAERGASHVVQDDGFQSRRVAADLALLVVDAPYGLGNGRVFPAGPLRAPLAPQMAAADGVVMIGAGGPDLSGFGKPVWRAGLEPREAARWRGRRLVAFAGIGRPAKFRDTLADLGAEVVGFRAFADHHVFTEAEAAGLIAEAGRLAAGLVTTAKDHARLVDAGDGALARLARDTAVLEIDLAVEPAASLDRRLAAFAALGRVD